MTSKISLMIDATPYSSILVSFRFVSFYKGRILCFRFISIAFYADQDILNGHIDKPIESRVMLLIMSLESVVPTTEFFVPAMKEHTWLYRSLQSDALIAAKNISWKIV